MIPIEIINKILVYVSELNNNIILIQYHPITNKEYYQINFYADSLWKIKSTLLMKKIFPFYSCNFSNKQIELYKFGILHYEKKLRQNILI